VNFLSKTRRLKVLIRAREEMRLSMNEAKKGVFKRQEGEVKHLTRLAIVWCGGKV